MAPSIRNILLLIFIAGSIIGCGPSAAELERERVARQQAEDARVKAEKQADAERQRREEESQKHDIETSRLWMYVFGIAVVAVILLFFGAAIGSSARQDAERNVAADDNATENTT